MASMKPEKSGCCAQDAQCKKEPVKAPVSPPAAKAPTSTPGPKKVEQKPQEPKKKVINIPVELSL